MLEFLSDAWLCAARECFDEALPLQPGVDARLAYAVSTADRMRRFGQLIANGQIHWTDDPVPGPDVEIRWRVEDVFAIMHGRVTGSEAIARTTIVEERTGGRYEGPPPPLDFVLEPTLEALPRVPGADLVVVFEYTQGPFGTIHYHLLFEDGILKELELGLVDAADVAVSVPFGHVMRFRRGDMTMLEVLSAGTVRGSEGALGLFAGILESPEFQLSLRSSAGSAPLALAALGQITCQPLYRERMDELLARTAPPA